MKFFTIISIALLVVLTQGQRDGKARSRRFREDLLDEEMPCTTHQECQSNCCFEPLNPRLRKRGGRRGGRNRGRGGRNRRGDDEDDDEDDYDDDDDDRRMLKHEVYEDYYSEDKADWFDGDRFCMESDVCRDMGP